MRLRLLSFVLLLLGIGLVAEGSVMLAIDNLGPSTWPTGVPPVLPGFTSYRLRMVSNGGLISGIDTSGQPERGIFGPLHQRWGIDEEGGLTKTIYRLEQNSVNSYSNDSHFLFTTDMLTSAGVAEEDNPGTGSPRANPPPNTAGTYWGVGTKLRAAFGIVAAYQSADTAFAYLVVPDATWDWNISHGWAQVAVGSEKFDVEIIWPEPASLSLLAFAGLLLRRR
jgi:hypothetical protein